MTKSPHAFNSWLKDFDKRLERLEAMRIYRLLRDNQKKGKKINQ